MALDKGWFSFFDYRYGLQGQEKDDEVKGEGNSYDFGARMYNPRIGRFFSIDPRTNEFPFWSPYSYAGNSPIRITDVGGEGPGDPLHHEFLTTVAIDIYDFSMGENMSVRGALLVMAQASLESGYGASAIKYKDYNLFGVMTNGTDYKRTTSAGRVRDYSKKGGYKGSVTDFYDGVVRKWPKYKNLLEKESFTADDINQALYTGKYIEGDKERNKTGHLSYNADDIVRDKNGNITKNTNKYGSDLYGQMKSVKKRFVASLDYKISQNKSEINNLREQLSKNRTEMDVNTIKEVKNQIGSLKITNNKLERIKSEVSKVKL